MATYLNETKGARAIHLRTGNHILMEAGASVEVEGYRVTRLAPGIVCTKADPKLAKAPAKAVKAVSGGKKAKASKAKAPANPDLTKARAEYKAKFGKQGSPRWDAATLREKIAAA